MSTPTKLFGFAVSLVAVFTVAVGVGRAVGPVGGPVTGAHGDGGHQAPTGDDPADTNDMASQAGNFPKGLMVSQDGYTLQLDRTTAQPGAATPVSLRILGPDGSPVTEFEVLHEKQLHLIAVRRDFSGFQHVHPEMDASGTWSSSVDLTPGQWRLFADFQATGGEALTLGADLAVEGDYRPEAPVDTVRTAVVDGYTVTLAGDLSPGEEAKLTLTVERDGRPVTDLEPYLGSYGHLVALREGDLAYLHVHPDGEPDDGVTRPGPDVVFYTDIPSAGGYRLYLDFKHQGVVRTAAFAVTGTGGAGPSPEGAESPAPSDDGHDDEH